MPKDLSSRQTPTGRSDTKEPKPRHLRSFNNFPAMSHKHLTSHRYGDISPFFYFYGTRGDKVPLITKQEIGTFTMQSPIESDVYANRTYIKVNHEALYPKNWELMRTIKQHGQDVPDHMRMEFNPDYIGAICSNAILASVNLVNDGGYTNHPRYELDRIFNCINILEHIYSQGSLLSMFNIHITNSNSLSRIVSYTNGNWDKWYDTVFVPAFQVLVRSFSEGGYDLNLNIVVSSERTLTYNIVTDDQLNGANIVNSNISLRYAIELMRNHPYNFNFEQNTSVQEYLVSFVRALGDYFTYTDLSTLDYFNNSVNIEVIGAYQLACAHFFTDDKIDNVYTSDLYFDAFMHICESLNSSVKTQRYTMNGISHYYDFFNGKYLSYVLESTVFSSSNYSPPTISKLWDFIRMLFGFRKSLKFGDYFTSARTNVLSGDPNEEYQAVVNNGAVSAVDMARSMQYTRLRHNVNLAGSRLSDYLSGIMGGPLLEAERDKPQWLAQQSFKVKGYEVENTASAQESAQKNIITTIMKTSNQKFSFKTYVDDQCIILGLQTYDVDRVYANTVDRHALHFDRYDDFIPQLQFVGDQEITNEELRGVGFYRDIPWAYSERYSEYKRRVSYASGAYISNLPSYAFITDNKEGAQPQLFIDSDYIRSANVEFDRFFASLSGWSLASYFHFRVKCIHDLTELSRNMVKNPQILK